MQAAASTGVGEQHTPLPAPKDGDTATATAQGKGVHPACKSGRDSRLSKQYLQTDAKRDGNTYPVVWPVDACVSCSKFLGVRETTSRGWATAAVASKLANNVMQSTCWLIMVADSRYFGL